MTDSSDQARLSPSRRRLLQALIGGTATAAVIAPAPASAETNEPTVLDGGTP